MDTVIGQTIKRVRKMTDKELQQEGWQGLGETLVIELGNGNCLFASRDDEGNGPGVIFGYNKKTGEGFGLLEVKV